MNWFTVVGIYDGGQRYAEWFEASSPQVAEELAQNDFLTIAGVFEGKLEALDAVYASEES